MCDFDISGEYIARLKNLKDDIIQVGGKGKSNPKLVSIVLNNLSQTFKFFSLIFNKIKSLFIKDLVTRTLEEVSYNIIYHQITLRLSQPS